jgi:hypothetical protein
MSEEKEVSVRIVSEIYPETEKVVHRYRYEIVCDCGTETVVELLGEIGSYSFVCSGCKEKKDVNLKPAIDNWKKKWKYG